MKTSELIRLLQKVDPEGNLECNIVSSNNPCSDIIDVNRVPANFDGPINKVNIEEGVCWSAKYLTKGQKVTLYSSSISELIEGQQLTIDKVDYSQLSEVYKSYYKHYHNKLDRVNKEIDLNIAIDHLSSWIKNKVGLEIFQNKEIIGLKDEMLHFLQNNPSFSEGNFWYRQEMWNKWLEVDNDTLEIIVRNEAKEN